MKLKKKYETPEIEVMILDPELDIIRTSDGEDNGSGGGPLWNIEKEIF